MSAFSGLNLIKCKCTQAKIAGFVFSSIFSLSFLFYCFLFFFLSYLKLISAFSYSIKKQCKFSFEWEQKREKYKYKDKTNGQTVASSTWKFKFLDSELGATSCFYALEKCICKDEESINGQQKMYSLIWPQDAWVPFESWVERNAVRIKNWNVFLSELSLWVKVSKSQVPRTWFWFDDTE